ncbi:cytoskeleton protein RodZ [Candidatus Erwinia haradaeae]|uniref:Cytoskeleton protein RodZ, partial n=1 Tax=Candidatus Erwinia haradaeae TaxID=1922217 RepID=A0A803FU66_9GAMM|nr:cytoskeleton protein RodZ [Candidatus Erwinia haradaeae]VFP88520.1 Cytoskeleton protein RodZ [Candidatus Erwinia haradaeae]
MTIEAIPDKYHITLTGERLRNARENMGLTQQHIAERLCLRVSIIRDIEDNTVSSSLASTFLRGYIRSYARLVEIPEEELITLMEQQTPVNDAKIENMKSYSLGQKKTKRDKLLILVTWLILIFIMTLTIIWWWKNYTTTQDHLISIKNSHTVFTGENYS